MNRRDREKILTRLLDGRALGGAADSTSSSAPDDDKPRTLSAAQWDRLRRSGGVQLS